MNMLNLNLQNNKKVLVLIFCIFIGIIIGYISDKLTNHKIVNSMVLSYLYLKNSENISFDSVLLKVPSYYIRDQEKDILMLLKYPPGGDLIFVKKNLLSKEKLNEKVKCLLDNMNFDLVNEGETTVDNEICYFISISSKSNPKEYREYLIIPNKSITIDFIGDEKELKKFWEIVGQIKFCGREGVTSSLGAC